MFPSFDEPFNLASIIDISEIKQINGMVTKILYETNDFTIASILSPTDQNHEPIPFELLSKYNTIVIKGQFLTNEGDTISVKGEMNEDPRHGYQFKVHSVVVDHVSIQGLTLFFSSDKFKGIGERKAAQLAEYLVQKNKENPLNALLDIPIDELKDILKTSEINCKNLKLIVETDIVKEQTLLHLSDYLTSNTMREAFYEKYKTNAVNIITSTPYKPIKEISGYGFKLADSIAIKLGFAANNRHRLNALIDFIIHEYTTSTGNTIIPYEKLLEDMASKGGSCSQNDYINAINSATEKDLIVKIKIDDDVFYQTKAINQAELNLMLNVLNLIKNENDISDEDIDSKIKESEAKRKITYDESQKNAIKLATKNNIAIITGGPGTGKTTTVEGIIDVICGLNHFKPSQVKRVAPTGRAAARLGNGAMTLHSFLNIRPEEYYTKVDKLNDPGSRWFDDKLKLIIVDEFSMVDTFLANQLIGAIPENTYLIIVGDVDQLPSVAPGQVLSDFIKSGIVPTAELTYIHRQGEGSTISELANNIKNGQFPDKFFTNTTNTVFTYAENTYNSPEIIKHLVSYAINDTDFNKDDIQTITPQNNGPHGVKELNQYVKYIQNPAWQNMNGIIKTISINGYDITVGDRVMNTKNCIMQAYDSTNLLNNLITNGDIGIVTDIVTDDHKKENHYVIVEINGEEYQFYHKDWVQLVPAYAITVHKSQGGEFPMVMLNLTGTSLYMLNRNLIYTAVTRASKLLCIIGDPKIIQKAVTIEGANRKTYLQQLLKK